MDANATLTVRSGDGIVFLDLDQDDYACRYDPERPAGPYAAYAASSQSGGPDRAMTVLTSRWQDADPSDFPRPSLAHILRFLAALAKAAWHFRGRSVADLARIARQLEPREQARSMTPEQASNLFRILLSFTPLKPQCLLGSFALLHFLSFHGLRADWVFGVQLFPFRAHCWVASGDLLLNERAHCIEDYEILWTVARP